MKHILVITLLALTACVSNVTPTVAPGPTPTIAPIATATIVPTVTPTPLPPIADPAQHNGLILPSELRGTTWQYYGDSPVAFWGYATRYGSEERAEREAYWYAEQAVAQFRAGHVIIGGTQGAGGYGYFTHDGIEYLIEGLVGEPYALARELWGTDDAWALASEQLNLMRIHASAHDGRLNLETSGLVGVISIKSPNDIGRAFCLYNVDHDSLLATPLGIVMVGGTAARTDWSIYGPSVNDDYDHQRLGVRVFVDNQLREWHWAADLPDHLYEAALEGDSALIGLIEYDGEDCGP